MRKQHVLANAILWAAAIIASAVLAAPNFLVLVLLPLLATLSLLSAGRDARLRHACSKRSAMS